MKYNVILADPPWLYKDSRTHASVGAARSAYECMSQAEICALPVQAVTAPDCMLALWATMPKLREAFEVIQAWGFQYITCGFVWVKINPKADWPLNPQDIYSGMGHWVNGNVELCLFARKGMPTRMAMDIKQVVIAPRGDHSVKPLAVNARLEHLFGLVPRLEMFSRRERIGWTTIGNGINGIDIKQALLELGAL